jgi:hypothetical protein
MEKSQLRDRFGDPDAVATGADEGLQEIYVYQRKTDGKQTTVRLRDGVVQAR